MLFDASGLFQILWNFFRCFPRHRQEPSRFFKMFHLYSNHFSSLHSFQIPADSSKFFKIPPVFSTFFEFSKFFEIPQNSLRFSQVLSDCFQFLPNFPISIRIPQILLDSDSLKFLLILSESPNFSQILSDLLKFLQIL